MSETLKKVFEQDYFVSLKTERRRLARRVQGILPMDYKPEDIEELLVIIEVLYDSLLEESTVNKPNDKARYERTRAALALVERS